MKSKLFLSITLLTILFTPTIAFAQERSEEITLSTYYPAPYGEYDELRANAMAIGPNYSDPSLYYWGGGSPTIENADLVVEGNVGIGTTEPGDKLHIANPGGGNQVGIYFEDPTAPAYGGRIHFDDTSNTFRFGTVNNDVETLGIVVNRSTGNVGIGTTSPGAKLDIVANSTAWGGWYEAIRLSQSVHSAITHPGGKLLFGLHGNENFYWADTEEGHYRMILYDGGNLYVRGNVGIGTTSPAAKLDVQGTIRVGQYTLPAVDGQAGQVLSTDGNGNLSWVNMAGGGPLLGQWISRNTNQVYGPVSTDGLVTAFAYAGNIDLYGYSDSSPNPNTARVLDRTYTRGGAITMPVKKGHRWKVTNAAVVYWIPLGGE